MIIAYTEVSCNPMLTTIAINFSDKELEAESENGPRYSDSISWNLSP